MMFGWSGDNGDPDNFFVPLLGCAAVKGGGNVSRWCNKDFENLLQMAKLATRQTDRAGFYAKAQQIAHEEAPWITIAHSVRFDPIRKEVTGYKMDATAHHYFNKVDMPGAVNAAGSYQKILTSCSAVQVPDKHFALKNPSASPVKRFGATTGNGTGDDDRVVDAHGGAVALRRRADRDRHDDIRQHNDRPARVFLLLQP